MGLKFSRFKRNKSSDEILEEIQSDIQSLEIDRNVVLQRQNYIVGRLIIYSIILYVITAVIFYFCFFPASLTDRVFYIPLLAFPLLVFLLKKFIVWYYRREITHNKDKLSELKAKKRKILEDVMNKETYKVAKEILEKYAPEQLKKPGLEPTLKPLPLTNSLQFPVSMDTKGTVPGPPPPHQLQVARVVAPQQPPVGFSPVHKKPVTPMVLQRRQGSPQSMHPLEGGGHVSPQRRLVRPIIPRERNFIDRIIESIVGDGPSNRYALICKNCSSHNGMALKEEFKYLAFRCAYCGFPNPSHKVRPAISLPHSRSSSEDRSIEVPEKIDENNESLKNSNETEGTKICSEDHSDSGPLKGPEPSAESADLDASRSEADSDESSSTPSGGVRPRKPLHLTD